MGLHGASGGEAVAVNPNPSNFGGAGVSPLVWAGSWLVCFGDFLWASTSQVVWGGGGGSIDDVFSPRLAVHDLLMCNSACALI